MKKLLVLLLCLASVTQAATAPAPANFQFQMINVGQVIQLIYAEALNQPYVISPEVLTDSRLVSFRYESKNGEIKSFIANFLDSLGLQVKTKNGVDYVSKKPDEVKTEFQPEFETFIYKPKYREVGYISRVLAPVFKGSFSTNRSIAAPDSAKINKDVPAGSAAAQIDQSADVLLFTGTDKEIAALQKLLPQIDDAKGQVMVRGVVYEVATTDKEGSAFSAVLSVLGGKFTVSNSGTTQLDSFIKLKTNAVDAVFSALSKDSRFNVVSKASMRVASGSIGHSSYGQEVPVLGSVSYPSGAGQAVQDVQYRSSGVIFDVRPIVRQSVVDLDVTQQLSDFVQTNTGVNNSPTLNKREVKTSLTLSDGDVVIIGGLNTNKQTNTSSRFSFLPNWMSAKSKELQNTEIVLVLHISFI